MELGAKCAKICPRKKCLIGLDARKFSSVKISTFTVYHISLFAQCMLNVYQYIKHTLSAHNNGDNNRKDCHDGYIQSAKIRIHLTVNRRKSLTGFVSDLIYEPSATTGTGEMHIISAHAQPEALQTLVIQVGHIG